MSSLCERAHPTEQVSQDRHQSLVYITAPCAFSNADSGRFLCSPDPTIKNEALVKSIYWELVLMWHACAKLLPAIDADFPCGQCVCVGTQYFVLQHQMGTYPHPACMHTRMRRTRSNQNNSSQTAKHAPLTRMRGWTVASWGVGIKISPSPTGVAALLGARLARLLLAVGPLLQ